MKEAGIEFQVIKVEAVFGTTRSTLYYSLHAPSVTVRTESGGDRGKLKSAR